MATMAAMRKTRRRAKPRWFLRRGTRSQAGRPVLRGATGVLRNFESLFAFDVGVFDDHRFGVDAHDFVALLDGHALGGEEDVFAIQEERGPLRSEEHTSELQ